MATKHRSLLSRIVLAGVGTAAAAGWFGVQLAPVNGGAAVSAAPIERLPAAVAPEGTPPGVRNRVAWQPSPIPSTQSPQSPQIPQAPGVRDRAAWQPSPVPSQPNGQGATSSAPSVPSLPSLSSAPAGGGAAALVTLPGAANPTAGSESGVPGGQPRGPAAVGAADYIPMSQQFTTDRLEALFDGGLPAQRGEWREVRFFSRALGQEAAYLAWVPPGYGTSQRAYPTLYLLHGVGSGAGGFGPEEWLGYALTEDLDRMLALDLIQPMIVILPNGEQGYWMNHADGGPKWGDFVAVDLVRHVDATFRTEPVRQRRAIGGLSMGAHGALQLALNHPDVFGVAGAHSPTLRPFEASPEFFGDQKWFAKHDPLSLVRNTNAAPRIATWIDVGATDDWRSGAEALRKAYEAKRAPLEFRVLEGEHEGWYWEYYLPEYLNFYSSALSATGTTPQGAPVVVSRPLVTAGGVSSQS